MAAARLILPACLAVGALVAGLPGASARAAEAPAPPTLEAAYPGLVSGVLASAVLGELPEGLVLRSGEVEIARATIDDLVANAPKGVREQIRKSALFMLEELAGRKLLAVAAREAAAKAGRDVAGRTDPELVREHLRGVTADAKLTDTEIADFYEKNKDMFDGASLKKVRATLEEYLLGEKRQQAISRHLEGLGRTRPLVVSAAWVKEQAVLARDNPVDQARTSGKPSLVDFGASGCRPCEMMKPVLKSLTKKFRGRLNVVFIHVRKEQVLATRYRVSSIPVQVFFDQGGREVYRHVGFFAQDAIEEKLAEMGVQ